MANQLLKKLPFGAITKVLNVMKASAQVQRQLPLYPNKVGFGTSHFQMILSALVLWPKEATYLMNQKILKKFTCVR